MLILASVNEYLILKMIFIDSFHKLIFGINKLYFV